MSSISLLPHTLYSSLSYWIYPLKDYIGESGCYVAIYNRDIGYYITQSHSFFMAMFRYNCLFNGTILKKINLGPNVSLNVKLLVNPNQLLYCSQYTSSPWLTQIHFTRISLTHKKFPFLT